MQGLKSSGSGVALLFWLVGCKTIILKSYTQHTNNKDYQKLQFPSVGPCLGDGLGTCGMAPVVCSLPVPSAIFSILCDATAAVLQFKQEDKTLDTASR